MSIYVFLGPTLPQEAARRILDATYLPPAKAGDVSAVTDTQTRLIVLIDGYYEQVPSVRHKEILFALSQGIPVVGCSSMGALRAAELAPFGMVGWGAVFEAFRSGVLDDDDEVSLNHGPESHGFRPLSAPMVNVREALRLARDRGILTPAQHDDVVASMKGRFYPDRTWRAMLDDVGRLATPESRALLEHLLREDADRIDVKAADAVALLTAIATDRERFLARHAPTFDFEPTRAWWRLHRHATWESRLKRIDPHVSVDALTRHVRVWRADRAELSRGALQLRVLWERTSNSATGPRSVGDTYFLADPAAGYQAQPDPAMADGFLMEELARRGELEQLARDVGAQAGFLRERGLAGASPSDTGRSIEELLAWARERTGLDGETLADITSQAGLESAEGCLAELTERYLYERNRGTRSVI
jgi:hypothetical protein